MNGFLTGYMRPAEGVGFTSFPPFSARIHPVRKTLMCINAMPQESFPNGIFLRVLPGRAWAEGQPRRSLSVILTWKNDVRDNFVIRIMILGPVVYA